MDGGGWRRRRRRKRRRHCRSFNRMEYRAEHSRQILTYVQRAGTVQPRIYPARRGISNRKREDTGRVHGGRGKRTKGKRYRALPSEEGATCNDSI